MRKDIQYILAKFLLSEFSEDAPGVNEWLEAEGCDAEKLIPLLEEFLNDY